MLRTSCVLATTLPLITPLLLGCAFGAADGAGVDPSGVESLESPLSYRDGSDAIRYEGDRFRQDAAGPFVQIDMVVRDLSASKQVGVRASLDGGVWQDHPAAFIETLTDGRERWRVEVRNGGATFSRIEYALFYKDPGSGSSWWDNNRQHNFALGVWDRVHRIGDKLESGKLTIELDVRNLAYEKQCAAVVTTDGWLTQSWAHGEYAFPTAIAGVERWTVVIDTTTGQGAYGLNPKASVFEYAVMCRIEGEEHWDNANSGNYRHIQSPLPSLSWSTPFDGATSVSVADDGTVFVSSPGGWVSGYAPGGAWLFARQASGSVRRMTWLSKAGALLIESDAEWPDTQWAAWGRDGTPLWSVKSRLSELVVGDDAEYLVGPAGGARLGSSAPGVTGPTGGCWLGGTATGSEAFPIVSRGGRMYCLDTDGVIRGYDLDKGKATGTWSGGWPWGTSDDGGLVVVSEDRTSLTGFGPGGQQRWSKSGLYVAVDSQYGAGKVCANHAAGNLAVVLNQDPAGGDPANHYFAGFDTKTGQEQFRSTVSDYVLAPCAGADGAFYYRPSYERYGRTMQRIAADGARGSINLGLNGQLFGLLADGRAVRRDWAYYPSDKGRIAITAGDGAELYSTSFFSGAASSYVAALAGNHLVIAEPGRVSVLTFD